MRKRSPRGAVVRRRKCGCPVASFTMKHASLCSSITQGGGKRRAGGHGAMIADRLVANRMGTAARRCVLLLIRFRPPCCDVC